MARGDGRLSRNPGGPADECGVFAVFAPGEEVAKLTFYGLYALQHRGQEAAGIATGDGNRVVVFKDLGLVSQVFDEATLSSLQGHIAIGHTRYSTTGGGSWANAQPAFATAESGMQVALAHNGNLVNTGEIAAVVEKRYSASLTSLDLQVSGGEPAPPVTTDSALITTLLARGGKRGDDFITHATRVLERLRGAFSLVFTDASTVYAARDSHGFRPLVLGKLAKGWVVASETAALDIVGAQVVREIEPGEMVAIDGAGVRSYRFAEPEPTGCLFEYVYLARPDTTISGRGVQATRVEIGRLLARSAPVDADLVIPVPESGTPAAIGYADESGIPYGAGLVKNSYVGRTFIQPSQTIRQLGIRLKLNPLPDIVAGKRLVVVDDSIVRGNTQRAVVKMLREAGAKQVHVRISSPPIKWPCFYGIDFATRKELIAAEFDVDAIARSIGADSLAYAELDDLVKATTLPAQHLCKACFDGNYPVPVQAGTGKYSLENPASAPPERAVPAH